MKGIVIGKLLPVKLHPTLLPCKTPSWVSVGVWVRVRVGSNLPGGQGVGKLPRGGGKFFKYRKVCSSLFSANDL